MEDLFEDTESEPYHFIVLDSQDTENIPPLWNDTSILKSLPALQIPETQFDFELTSIPDTPLSPVHNFNVSKVHLFDSKLDNSCHLNLNRRRRIMDEQNKVIDETCSQGSSTSDSSGNFGKSLNQSMIENPKFYEKTNSQESSKNISEKVLSVKEYKDSSDTKDIPSTSFSEKMTKEKNVTVLVRQSLFKNYQEDTESDEKEPNPIVCTPSTHIGSLQFSQESMFVPDTADEMNYIEPSPEYNPTPTIIPDSPTVGMSDDSDDDTQDPTIIETTIMKQKESENLDTTVEPVVEDSARESQSFQLLYLATQASQMSQVERCVSPEKPMVGEEPKKETELSHHDNSSIMSESEDLNLHLSFNTQTESCRDAASQRSSFSGKMSISQSPATPKDNSNDEVKFKLILPSSAHSPSQMSKDETHFQGSSSTSVKSKHLGTSQQDVSQGILSAPYKMKSEEKAGDPKIVQSDESLSEMSQSEKRKFPDILPDSQEKDSTIVFGKFYKMGSQGRRVGSQKRDSPVESQKVSSQNVAHSSQKKDSPDESQKGSSQNIAYSSQKKDYSDESQKGSSQNIAYSSQKKDSSDESQKGSSQNVAHSSQKRDSLDESQKGYSQNVAHSSQKKDSPDESQKGSSQNIAYSSQKKDSPDESQKDYSQYVTHSSQKRDSPDESQKGSSQKIAHSSEKRDSPDESQKDSSQNVAHSSQKRDSPDESQKGYSQNVAHKSQKRDSPDELQKGYSQNVAHSSQKRDSPDESQKGYSQNVAHSSQKRDSPDESQEYYSQDMCSKGAKSIERATDTQKKISQNTSPPPPPPPTTTTTTSQQEHLHGSQEHKHQATISGSQERNSQRLESQDKNILVMSSGSAGKSSGSHKEDRLPKELNLNETSSDILIELKKKDSQDVTVGSQKESSSEMHAPQMSDSQAILGVKQKEKTSRTPEREISQDLLAESQRKISQDLPGNSQNKDSQVILEIEQLQEASNSLKGNSQSMSSVAQREQSQTKSQTSNSQGVLSLSQKEDSPDKVGKSQKENSQGLMHGSQKRDSQGLMHGSQKEGSQDIMHGSQKRDSQGLMHGSQKEGSQGLMRGSQKEGSQGLMHGSQKEGSQGLMRGSQKEGSQDIMHGSQKRDSQGLMHGSQKEGSQGSMHGSQKEGSQDIMHGSQKEGSEGSMHGSQKEGSQDIMHGSQKRDSQGLMHGSQKEGSQGSMHGSQKEGSQGSMHGSQKEGSQDIMHGSQKRDSQGLMHGSQKEGSQGSMHGSQKEGSQDIMHGSQKEGSQGLMRGSQKEGSQGLMHGSQKEGSQGLMRGSQKEGSQDIMHGSQKRDSQGLMHGSQKEGSQGSMHGSQKEGSQDIMHGSQKRDSQGLMYGSQKRDSPCLKYGSQKEGSQGLMRGSQKEGSQDLMRGSQKEGSQGLMRGSQKEGSQGLMHGSQKEGSQGLMRGSQKEGSQGLMHGSQKEGSQDIMHGSQKEGSQGSMHGSQKEGSQGLMHRSQKEDSQGTVRNTLDISTEFQKKNSQSLSEKEKSSDVSARSQKEESQHTLPASQKNDASASQEKISHLQAGSQSHLLPHVSKEAKEMGLSVGSQETKSQSSVLAISQDVAIPAIPRDDSQPKISVMNSANLLVTEINAASPNKDKKSIKSSCQQLSYSQPSKQNVSGSQNSNLRDMKQWSCSLDSSLPHLTNVEPLNASPLKRRSPTDKATTDSARISSQVSEDKNLKQTPEKITAFSLGPVSNFQSVRSLPKSQDSCSSEPIMVLSQERKLSVKMETVSSSQPSTLKGMYPEHPYQITVDVCKKNVSGEKLSQDEQKALTPTVSRHEQDSLKVLYLSDTENKEPNKDTVNDKETSGKTPSVSASPEKMEIDFAAIELPTKPNICYRKDTEHSQGSSTITLSQNHQFEVYSSQMGISQELNKNSKEVSSLSNLTACDKNLVSSPPQECPKNILSTAIKKLTLIKPKCKGGRSELPEASSTIYPSQTSASQQRHSPTVEVQPQQRITSANVARYNINSVQTNPNPEQPLAGPSNDPYLFVGSQPKTIQTGGSKKKQRRSKGLSKFTQKRMQKKSLPKKKCSLTGRSWTIRKDYKSPVHRVRFEPLRRRTASVKLLKDDPIFLKVPSYKDIETIFSRQDNLKEQVKSSCSSDGSTQKSTNKDDPQQLTLFSNLQNVLQRKIVEETVVQLVYRKITIETVKNSKVVNSRTIVEKDDPLIIQRSRNEDFKYLNSAKGVSPFCSPNSLTSGEYADVSSLSHSDSKTSNSSSFGSLATKTSTFEVPMSPLVQISSSQSKKDNLSGPQNGQPVTLRSLQSPNTDDDLLKAPSPITSVYKDAHSVYCSTEELHAVNQNCDDCRSYVTETVPALEASSGDPAKSRATVVQNSDSLFSSAENLNTSDSGPTTTIAGQETVIGKEGQRSVDSLVQEADQSLTLHEENVEISEIDLRTPPASQKWSSPQKRKASHSEEISEETGIDKPPPQKRLRKDSEEGTSLQSTKISEEAGSPEITMQDHQQIKMPSLSPESSKKDKSEIGMKVMAKWKDGYFYPGKTASLEKGGKCLVNFADGDQLWVKINQILVVDYLPHGQSVMVQSKDNFFDSAMIVDHISISSDSSDSFVYQVEMDDNTTVNCARQKVILSEDQAAILLSDEEYQMTSAAPSTPRLSGADVSLDNLVEGSRRSAKKAEVLSEKMESRSSKRTKLMRMEPQAMSTPTPKRKAKALKKDSKDAESLIGAAVSSPKSQKSNRTPQVKKELFDAVKGPIPKQKNLFKGMNFLLTYTEKSTEQKLMDKKMIQEFSSESSTNISYSDVDEPEIPFDKHHLQSQIEAGGGTIFDSWSDKFISKKTKSFIISNSYQRTIKYLQGLAAGIPCVSYLWIRDCCKQGISSDYKAYMLQAGISLKKKTLIECKLKPECLDDTQVLVFSTQPDFVSTWSEILTLAGCNVVKKFKKSRDQSRDVDIVITDKTCSVHIRKQAETYNTPLLSTEWVIQCLIHGQKLCYTGHEKYKFDYEE